MEESLLLRWSRTKEYFGRRPAAAVALGLAIVVVVVSTCLLLRARAASAPQPDGAAKVIGNDTVELTEAQLKMIKVGPIGERAFPPEREAIGSIDFDQDLATQVFAPYQGRIAQLRARLGDDVKRGDTLFTVESPDLVQAESTLIAAAGVQELTTRALQRARELAKVQGMADKDLQQAISEQQTAEGALNAARAAVLSFGKTSAEIGRIIRTRTIDPYLVVASPITGRVTARNAAPGLLVQAGSPPAPYAVADISHVWLNASVTESDMPFIQRGQRVEVSVLALPGRTYRGQISVLGASVDPQSHRGTVRAEIADSKHELLPGMLASFLILTGDPVSAPAVPLEGVVREGDGTMAVWVTADRHRFVRRTVRIGLQRDGFDQILDGVAPGSQVVIKGALFLDNLFSGGVP